MSIVQGLRSRKMPRVDNVVTVQSVTTGGINVSGSVDGSASFARKLSAVDRCIEILSDSMAKLPNYVYDVHTRERVNLPVLDLLNLRPNEAMTPSVRKKLLETCRLEGGNGYDWIIRDPKTYEPVELIPLPYQLVTPWWTTNGEVRYTVTHPYSGEPMVLPSTDVCHYKGMTRNGLLGVSVLRRAADVIAGAQAAQEYNRAYYESGGQPSGILRTEADLGGDAPDPSDPSKTVNKKELLRREWERIHAGPKNGHRIAVLDFGLDYKPLAASNKDAQFLESKEMSIRDIARFFGVPLYKLQEGKQAYGSNEQNAIEYVVGTLHPNVCQYREEQTWRLLSITQLTKGLKVGINMMAELQGDTTSRAAWYKTMREVGGFSVNDILQLEDMPDVEGGDERLASLNYVPLRLWPELSINRNGGNGNS